MLNLDNFDVVKNNYVISLVNNEVNDEVRSQIIEHITDVQAAMDILINIIESIGNNVQTNKPKEEYLKLIQDEYSKLELDKFLSFEYLKDMIIVILSRFYNENYELKYFKNFLYYLYDNIDNIENEELKKDFYLLMIRVLSAFNLVPKEIKIAQKVMDYYNKLPEGENRITILPDIITAF